MLSQPVVKIQHLVSNEQCYATIRKLRFDGLMKRELKWLRPDRGWGHGFDVGWVRLLPSASTGTGGTHFVSGV